MATVAEKLTLSRQKMQDERRELKRRSAELSNRAAKQELDVILHAFPDAAVKALEHLKDLGYDVGAAQETPVKKSKKAMASEKRKDIERQRIEQQQAELESQGFDKDDIIPAGKEYLSDLSVEILKNKVVSMIDPQTCSVPNLQAWFKTLARGSTKVGYA